MKQNILKKPEHTWSRNKIIGTKGSETKLRQSDTITTRIKISIKASIYLLLLCVLPTVLLFNELQCFIFSDVTADSGVSSNMQLDDLGNQQNGLYQSLPESISSAQTLYSPPSQVDSQLHPGPYQQSAGQATNENNTQTTTQLHQGAYPQQPTAGQQQPGPFRQQATQLHQGHCQCQTVSICSYIFTSPPFRSYILQKNISCHVFWRNLTFYLLLWTDSWSAPLQWSFCMPCEPARHWEHRVS